MIDIRLPNITGADAATQMSEVKSYLYQMVEQLNWALNTLETGGVTTSGSTAIVSGNQNGVSSGGDNKPSDVLENFGALKSLIIKTAEATNNEIVRLDDAINAIQAANKSIDTVTESYYKSTSPAELVGGSWSDTYPGWEQGTYIWTRSTVTYSDGSAPTITEPVCVTGAPGAKGELGETGVGIASVDVEYRLSDSDAELTEGYDWQTTIETIPGGMSLWSRTKVTYTDGTVAYSGLSCISKYNIETVAGAIDDAVREGCEGVYSYIEEQKAEYDGLYYANSDFGEFLEKYKQVLSIDPTKIEQAYSDIQYLIDNTETIGNTLAATTANIKTGKLYEENGIPVYGVEVGQMTEVNGSEVFNKFARFTSGKLTFYDQDGGELSWISDYKLYITNAQITGDMWMGGYKVDTSNGIAFIWSGG